MRVLGLSFNSAKFKNDYQLDSSNPFVTPKSPAFLGKKPLKTDLQKDTFVFNSSKVETQSINENAFTSGVNTLIENIKSTSNQILNAGQNPIDIITKSIYKATNSLKFKNGNSNNEEFIKGLLEEINSENIETQKTAIALLGKLKNQSSIRPLVDLLNKNSTNPEVAIEIIYALGNTQDIKAIQPIIDILADTEKDETLRTASATILSKIKNRRASKPLFEILRNVEDSPMVRAEAALALSEFPTIRNCEQLAKILNDSSEKVRANAVLALGIIGNKDYIPLIVPLLNDSDSTVKSNAALTLGNLKAEEAIPELIRALEETNSEVIVSISRALKYIGKEKTVPEIIKALENTSNDIVLRRNAAASLQIVNDPQAAPILNKIITDENEDLTLRNHSLTALIKNKSPESIQNISNILNNRNENFQLRINAAAGIGILGNENNLNELVNAASDTEIAEIKNNCLNSIRNIVTKYGKKSNFDATKLLPFLKENNPNLIALTADTLGILQSREAIDKLVEIAQNKGQDPLAKAYAIEALGKIGDTKVKDTLLNLLKNEEHEIAAKASAALYNIGCKDELFKIVKSNTETFRMKNHAAGTLIANGEMNKELEVFLKPGLGVTKLHKINITGQGVEVGVIDDKVNATHKEFGDRVVVETLEHGTMVAGNLGGNVSGVAPKVTIHSYNAFGNQKNLVNSLEKIIDQKINGENDIKVVNVSLGYSPKLMSSPDVQNEVKRFDQLAKMANKLGITVIVAAGNDGKDIPVPTLGTLNLLCLSNNIISVGASTTNGSPDSHDNNGRSDFSSYPGKDCERQIDVMAPGFEITLPDKSGSYKTVCGTSFSAPFVSGLVSLMYQVNPNITPDEVKVILKETALELKDVPKYMQGSGEVNPLTAVVKALKLSNLEESRKLALALGVNGSEQLEFEFNKFDKIA